MPHVPTASLTKLTKWSAFPGGGSICCCCVCCVAVTRSVGSYAGVSVGGWCGDVYIGM